MSINYTFKCLILFITFIHLFIFVRIFNKYPNIDNYHFYFILCYILKINYYDVYNRFPENDYENECEIILILVTTDISV